MEKIIVVGAGLSGATIARKFADGGADVFFPDLSVDPQWRLDRRGEDMTENGLTFRYEEYVPLA